MEGFVDSIRSFIANKEDKRPVVLITSGGTKVNLEKNMVRFIDNFSKGERGSACCESFLRNGYRVVFLHRKGSVFPFTTGVRKEVSEQLDGRFLSSLSVSELGQVLVNPDSGRLSRLISDISEYQRYTTTEKALLVSEFEDIQQYLEMLRQAACELACLGPAACMFLAAAVSDFYVPADQMSEHKIQSSTGLTLELSQVPKTLGQLTAQWAPQAYIVSFKLETDKNILIQKAVGAIRNYNVDLVVANLLQTRRDEVLLVSPTTAGTVSTPATVAAAAAATTDATTDATASTAASASVTATATATVTTTAVAGTTAALVDGIAINVQLITRPPDEEAIDPPLVTAVIDRHTQYRTSTSAAV